MKNIFYLLSLFGFVASFLALLLFAYWYLYPYNPVTFKGDKFEVLTPVVKQGGTLDVISDYCKNMDIPATVSKSFVDGLIFLTPQYTSNIESGCHKKVISTAIPNELPPGEYHLHNLYIYDVNPIRRITVMHDTENFTVIEK